MLKGQIAVITGSSRGVGRGIALSLGEAGATVYVTGRSTGTTTTESLPGTVEGVAAEVTERGGTGIAVTCDFRDDTQIEALFARVAAEQGRLDLLVNNVWAGYEQQPAGLSQEPFWKQELTGPWDRMFQTSLRAHLACSRLAVPLMLPQQRGLIVNTIGWVGGRYLMNLYYDLVKHAVTRMSYGMALELKPHNIASVALAPGFVRSERVMAAHALYPFDLSGTESPEYVGRAVQALASDPGVLDKTGQILTAGGLAAEYGFTDVDGRRVPTFTYPAGYGLD